MSRMLGPTGPGERLEGPPPYVPGGAPPAGPRAGLMDSQLAAQGAGGGLGSEAANPQIVIMEALGGIEERFNLLSSVIPQLAPAFTQLIANLRQVIPQAMADQVAGALPGAGAAATMAGPGGAPGMGAPAPSAPPTAPAGTPMPM